jgi:hypothetical protein
MFSRSAMRNSIPSVDSICHPLEIWTSCRTSKLACMKYVTPLLSTLGIQLTFAFQTLRWRPVVPGGIPHVLTKDDIYNDYLIPKGTMVFSNVWSINQNENEYENPQEFIPERFLINRVGSRVVKDGEDNDHLRRTIYSFGAGRRVCVGQKFAENSLVSGFLCPQSFRSCGHRSISIQD